MGIGYVIHVYHTVIRDIVLPLSMFAPTLCGLKKTTEIKTKNCKKKSHSTVPGEEITFMK